MLQIKNGDICVKKDSGDDECLRRGFIETLDVAGYLEEIQGPLKAFDDSAGKIS